MGKKSEESAVTKPPAWLTRAEKIAFRRLLEGLRESKRPPTVGEIDLLADYVAARSRVKSLRNMLGGDLRENSTFLTDKARILALSKQIDSTTALAGRLAEKVGLVAGAGPRK